MRWWPRSLFSRLVLVLVAGLLVAQLVGLAIHAQDRGELLLRASGAQSARRIADIVRLLDAADAAGRARIARVLATPPLVVRLDGPPLPAGDGAGARAALFAAMLRSELGADWPVVAVAFDPGARDGPLPHAWGPGRAMGGWGHGPPSTHAPMQPAVAFAAQVRLRDGTLVTFDARQSTEAAGWPWRLLASLAVLLLAVVALSLLAVRWTTQPLDALADAADDLGRNLERPPMPETGPLEVVRAARAFNTMQARLVGYVRERTSVLAAMSHDLQTPVTRLRLRAELLPDAQVRGKFTQDLDELQAMVAATLDYLRGGSGAEAVVPIDIDALLASLQADLAETGQAVTLAGAALQPYPGQPVALKRCLRNLLENAARYGGAAFVEVRDGADRLEIRVRDAGPGLPPGELERVFEPFHRVEASRSRATGGTGLGLTIARNIAQLHGGTLTLRNHPEGGLEAVLVLPRAAATVSPPA